MTEYSGFVIGALQVGLTDVLIKPVRGIYNPTLVDGSKLPNIIAQAVIEERHTDQMEITDHPVEQGASITDHAFKLPSEVTLRISWSNSPPTSSGLVNFATGAAAAVNSAMRVVTGAAATFSAVQSALSGSGISQINSVYSSLLNLQEKRALFDLYTGKRVYKNMLCKTLSTETDYVTANILNITMVCQQVILVNTKTVALPKTKVADPSATASPVDKGTISAIPVSGVGA